MNTTRGLRVCTVGFVVLLAALCAQTARAQSGHEVSASYKIAETTDLGSQVRVTLQLRLNNNSEVNLSITKVALRSLMPGPPSPEESVSVLLRPQGTSDLTHSFTISRQEYDQWEKGGRPRLFLRLQTDDGHELTRTIAPMSDLAGPLGVE